MSGRSFLIRAARVSALLVGLLVLALSVVTTVVTARDKQVAAQDSELGSTLGQQVDAIGSYFERSRVVDALLANNPAFADFYRAPGTNQAKINAGGTLLRRVNDALAHLETLFPGQISSACFIDSDGAEIASVIGGVRAPSAGLSADEDDPFVAATLALAPGRVYQAAAFESADTHEQVISSSTVVSAAGHRGIVHFEITLDSFRMTAATGGLVATIVDARSGQVLVDSRTPTTTGRSTDRSFVPLVQAGQERGFTTLGNRRVAFRRLPSTTGNANEWYVAVSAPAFGQGWTRGISVGSLALLAGALLTILVSGASWRSHLRAVRRAATHDALTGLPNRSLLAERIRAALRSGRRGAPAVTVLAVDLDRFKEVNNLVGHRYGDLLLREVARRITAVAPAGATVARFGADDFAVLVPGNGHDEPCIPERLLAALHDTFLIDGISVDIEAAVGVARGPEHGTGAEELLRHADAAMVVAKQRKSGYVVYDPAADQQAPNRLALLGDLRRAIDADDQIMVHYQPKIGLNGGRLVGVEALVRWQHPRLGRMAPDSFIPMAETTALILGLTAKVLDIAMRQAKSWSQAGLRIPVAVNLSARCLHDPTLADQVLDLLDRHGVPPVLLELEITESMVMVDPDRALQVLRRLHEAGIRLSVDDFGTGHSSMAYLKELPVDELKIDRSFVQEMTRNGGDAVLVQSAIALGHNLGLSVVAEGVENADILAALDRLGCDVVQGFHLGRPMPAEEVATWLAGLRPQNLAASA